MRYHIDTIPMWDALRLEGECPLCAVRRKLEIDALSRYLGASVMEPDIRVKVNEIGFCAAHQTQLFAQKNRLGHALMMDTHMRNVQTTLEKPLKHARTAQSRRGLGRKESSALCEAAAALDASASRCIICEDIQGNMMRYQYTFVYLWQSDAEFRKAFAASKGTCVPDAAHLLRMADEELRGDQKTEFAKVVCDLLQESLKRVEGELEGFTLGFDYRNQGKEFPGSRDALERAVNKLRGWCVGAEPNPK